MRTASGSGGGLFLSIAGDPEVKVKQKTDTLYDIHSRDPGQEGVLKPSETKVPLRKKIVFSKIRPEFQPSLVCFQYDLFRSVVSFFLLAVSPWVRSGTPPPPKVG